MGHHPMSLVMVLRCYSLAKIKVILVSRELALSHDALGSDYTGVLMENPQKRQKSLNMCRPMCIACASMHYHICQTRLVRRVSAQGNFLGYF